MSDSEKIDKIYDFVMKHDTDIALLKASRDSHAIAIKDVTEIGDAFIASRNKLVGAAWVGGALGGVGFISGVGTLIINLFTKHG